MKIKNILLPTLFLGIALNANAEGLIGTEHVEFSLNFTNMDTDEMVLGSTPGFDITLHEADLETMDTEVRYNMPVSLGKKGGFDVHGGMKLSTGEFDIDATVEFNDFFGPQSQRTTLSVDVRSYAIYGGGTAYSTMGNFKPYAALDLGFQRMTVGSDDENDLFWRGTVGVEVKVTDTFVFKPRASLSGTDDGVGVNNAGAVIQFTLVDQFQLGFQADYLWDKGDVDGYSVGFSGALFF